jgi:pimeloyl-ACP methyl ester carboxylesterase
MKLFTTKLIKRLVTVLSIILACIILFLLFLLILSPGKVNPLTDKEGNIMQNSISEKVFIDINGIKQGMFIQSEDITNPVLLILHGGPGIPEYFLNRKYPTNLEKNFTVVWWEQRGAGLSYNKKITADTLTLEQYIEDTIAVTNYLRERFSKDKIYLVAHSFGTYLGIQTVQKAPELFNAYIAVAQITHQLESEKLAYNYMVDYYRKCGDKKTVDKLLSLDYTSKDYKKIRDSIMHKAGIGTARDMKSVGTGVFLESFLANEYTLSEKLNIWKGRILLNQSSLETLKWSKDYDVRTIVKKVDIPVYFVSGIYDYTVNYQMSKDYLKEIDAPVKGFYTFSNSAHSPIFEEPEWFNQILVSDVLNSETYLSDK